MTSSTYKYQNTLEFQSFVKYSGLKTEHIYIRLRHETISIKKKESSLKFYYLIRVGGFGYFFFF